jgi:ribosomal protein L11 methyltransferase
VLALDIDPVAVAATADNARANGVGDKISAECGGLETVLPSARRFDLVIVNILARVIIQLTEAGMSEIVRPGGAAIFSGIIDTQLTEVEAALRRAGLQPNARHQRGDWVLVEATRPAG